MIAPYTSLLNDMCASCLLVELVPTEPTDAHPTHTHRQRVTNNIDRYIYKFLCDRGDRVPRNHLCPTGLVTEAGEPAFDLSADAQPGTPLHDLLCRRLICLQNGVSSLADAQRSGRTSWAGVVLDPSLPNFLRVLLFLATWDLGIVADSFPEGGEEDHRHQFMDLRSSLETMMCQPTGNGVTFDAITTPEAAMVIKAAMPFVAERYRSSYARDAAHMQAPALVNRHPAVSVDCLAANCAGHRLHGLGA